MKLHGAMLCVAAFLIGSGTPVQAASQDRPPSLRCAKAKFVSDNGQPIARQSIGLMWLEVDWNKDPAQGADIHVKDRKELKTDENGESSIPSAKDGPYGPYLLEVFLLKEGKPSAEGHFQSTAKAESCSQLLEVRGKEILLKPQNDQTK